MAWEPLLDITGDTRSVVVSATDVASHVPCGRFLAIKTRKQVRAASWERSYAGTPFPLGDVQQVILASHSATETGTYSGLRVWLIRRLDLMRLHRAVRPYVETAVQNILEAHEAIEAEVGPLSLLKWWPTIGSPPRELNVWAPLYTTVDGTREIRRLRVGSIHDDPDEDDRRWAAVAAFVAARYPGPHCSRVRVVEVGAVDGSVKVLFDDTPEQADAEYRSDARDRAASVTEQDHVVPCSSCGDCKAAGACSALMQTDGVLGQDRPGVGSRSIAPTALAKYAECPAQWLLDVELHLPKEQIGGEAIARGASVHRWLEAAHRRGVACSPADLPPHGDGTGPVGGTLTAEEYAVARPFLEAHLPVCPLGIDGAEFVAVEQAAHGWDATANVVAVAKPDLVYRLGDRVLVRETKTVGGAMPDRDTAYNRYLQVPFLLALLADGLAEEHGGTVAAVELEVLVAGQPAAVWAWHTDDLVDLAVARSDVRRAVELWHQDTSWEPSPGPHCERCPVRRWCPDRDAWQSPRAGARTEGPEPADTHDEPPF